ncbi:MAG: xylanase [Clostridiales bacterium]|nr:xylanase [Clostridiales bacterium]
MKEGAIRTGIYPNYLVEVGVGDAEAEEKVRAAFQTIFFDPEENFCHRTDEDAWCMVDTGNIDARTEGMSYGMMMCVQMDRQDIFDKLWNFTDRYMRLREGPFAGYFAWSVRLDGKHNAEGPAPDGEEYFAMALFMASARWGDGEGIFNYSAEAREILRHAVHQHEITPGGQPMWDPETLLIRFVPGMMISDPSYHLPHFYDLFAEKANEEDREFWRKAAAASRAYIAKSAHPVTGLSPEYAAYDGQMVLLFRKPWEYYSDAYRVAENIALDHIWFGAHPEEDAVNTRLQDFFAGEDMENLWAYKLDGTPQEEPAMHPTAIRAVLGAASVCSESVHRLRFMREFAQLPLRKGKRRYYDNCLYFFCLMMLTGHYRIYR